MNILITGGAGFIGSHLAEFHLSRGDEVYVIDDLSTGSEKNIAPFLNNPKFHFEKANILSTDNLLKQAVWADRIYHMAAMVGMFYLLANPVETLTTNILCMERLLRLMSEGKSHARMLVASSSEIYGPSTSPLLKEEDMLLFRADPHSKWIYATSKFTEEMLALTYARAKGIKATAIRFFNTIGPRQSGRYGMVVPRFIEQALKNQPITVYGTGAQSRSFCDVRDTVAALDIIANRQALIGETINLGQDNPITMNALAKKIIGLARSNSPITYVNYKEAYGEEYEDIMQREPDLTKFNAFTSYQFQWNLDKTLLDLIHIKRDQDM